MYCKNLKNQYIRSCSLQFTVCSFQAVQSLKNQYIRRCSLQFTVLQFEGNAVSLCHGLRKRAKTINKQRKKGFTSCFYLEQHNFCNKNCLFDAKFFEFEVKSQSPFFLCSCIHPQHTVMPTRLASWRHFFFRYEISFCNYQTYLRNYQLLLFQVENILLKNKNAKVMKQLKPIDFLFIDFHTVV